MGREQALVVGTRAVKRVPESQVVLISGRVVELPCNGEDQGKCSLGSMVEGWSVVEPERLHDGRTPGAGIGCLVAVLDHGTAPGLVGDEGREGISSEGAGTETWQLGPVH